MKLLFDLFPVILFFATFKYADGQKDWASSFATEHFGALVSGGQVGKDEAAMLLATLVMIVCTVGQVVWLKLRGQKVDKMIWISLVLVVVLGGMTIWFHNENFIKWKPSALYWAFGLTFWASNAFFRKNLIRAMLGEQISLPEPVWHRLNFSWVAFFGVMGLVNLWVAHSFDTDTWVNFKMFGATGMMLVFMVGQGFYLNRHMIDEPQEGEATQPSSELKN